MSIYQSCIKFYRNQKNNSEHFIQKTIANIFYSLANSSPMVVIKNNARLIASAYDLFTVVTAWLLIYAILIGIAQRVTNLSFYGANHELNFSVAKDMILWCIFYCLPIQFILFRFFGLYRGFWRFASLQDLKKIVYVSILGGIVAWVVLHIINSKFQSFVSVNTGNSEVAISELAFLPPSLISIVYSLFLIAFLATGRLLVRLAKNYMHLLGDYQRVIIVGAGNAGEGLVRDLLREKSHPYKPIVFVDDDLHKVGREIHGVRVAGTVAKLAKLIAVHKIDLVLIAIPSASSASMRSVVNICETANVRCYTLPSIKDLANGRVSINVLRSISLEDLLGRYPVVCQWDIIKSNLNAKTILITGGGGSIGSELCRQIALLGEKTRIIIVDSNEYNLYLIDMDLRQKFPDFDFHSILLNITDRVGIKEVLRKFVPTMIFHAAAYKHVPLLETQPRMAMFNNIIGTEVLAEEAMLANVEIFVLISSDKAVNPTNIMGATKRAAEYFCQNSNNKNQLTKFITVRFGNVLDSAGSVIPLFKKQIEMGGPVTVTHPEITRFFMTIPEASQLILQAAFLGHGGEIFVLDMGEPIKIHYLAEQMIRLSGKRDIKIAYTGLRPGEKLYEECFYPDEQLQPTTHPKIRRAQSQRRSLEEIQKLCEQIRAACEMMSTSDQTLVSLLKHLVPEYQPQILSESALVQTEEIYDQELTLAAAQN